MQKAGYVVKKVAVALMVFLLALFTAGYRPGDAYEGEGAGKVAEEPKVMEKYRGYKKTSQYVSMPDGTKLAVDIYLPGKGEGTFPVLFQYTPYGRAYVVPDWADVSFVEKVAMMSRTGTWSNLLDRMDSTDAVYGSTAEEISLFLSHGYAYVCADMRGTGASFGSMMDFCPEIAKDGRELVDWIARQKWCDGNVGMFGGSYLGYSQWVTAEEKPAALKCIVPEMTPLDGYTGEIRPGGIFLWAYSQNDTQILLEHNCYLPEISTLPTAPVADEDGDGDLSDEVPLDLNGNGSFLDDYRYPEDPDDEPKYSDGKKRSHIYYLAVKEHLKNVPYSKLGPMAKFRDSDLTWGGKKMTPASQSPAAGLAAIKESGIAILNYGGWMDPFIRGTAEAFATLKDTNPSYLLIGPGYHMETSPYWEYCGEDEEKEISATYMQKLRFFDRYLKHIDNGFDKEPPVKIYNMQGDGWRKENEWPLKRQELTDWHLDAKGKLSEKDPAPGTDSYRADFTASSVCGSQEEGARYLMETPDELPVRTKEDEKCICWTSEPLGRDTEVTGHPVADLYVSSTAKTGDFFFYLEDVDEEGEAVLVTEGLLNAKFAALCKADGMTGGKVHILPDLPWHGYRKKDCEENILADNAVVRLTVDLMPTSWTFRKGHKIRLSLACADYPTFELTPELCPSNDPSDLNNTVPVITVHRTKAYPSKITLPVIP